MLILTRRTKETLVIGEDGAIQITVLNIKEKFVQIRVTRMESMPVSRQEIYLRILQDN